jgi:uncharacterized membrane protein
MAATTRWLRRAFSGGAIAWTAALPTATFIATRHEPTTVGYLFAFLVYAVGSVVCHQLPERSFHVWGRQMPVCARCTGIYVGAAIAVVVALIAVRPTSRAVSASHVGGRDSMLYRPLLVFIVAALPTAATLVYEWTTGITPANWVRAAAGLAIGGAGAWLVARGLAASPEVN